MDRKAAALAMATRVIERRVPVQWLEGELHAGFAVAANWLS